MSEEGASRGGTIFEYIKLARDFDLRPLRYVLAAAEHMSIRAAAEMLDVEPSSVSRAIRDFEDRIGVGFFERGQFGVRLTDAGRKFIEQTVPALQQIGHAIHHAGAAGRAETGTLRVGVISTLAGGFLRELVSRYEAAYPGVWVDIYDGTRPEHIKGIRTRKLDIGFFTGNGEVKGCETIELWDERVHIAMARSHPLAREKQIDWLQLRDEMFIISRFGPGPEIRDYIVRRICDYSTYPTIVYRDVHQDTLMHMVAMGKGITPVAEAWSCVPFRDLSLIPLSADADIVPFSAVWSPRNDNPSLRRLIKFAERLATESSRQNWLA
ncbi:LysR family transcriptional regulator [Pseudaminobacter sp. NGMCC 1.201702]|uniref:LysR family transcriptional regulator n=1 Tax=Pseudaminobacter sp. NGMCC 1.201702 TaxID=3391825 RepID=UPI0039EE9A5F